MNRATPRIAAAATKRLQSLWLYAGKKGWRGKLRSTSLCVRRGLLCPLAERWFASERILGCVGLFKEPSCMCNTLLSTHSPRLSRRSWIPRLYYTTYMGAGMRAEHAPRRTMKRRGIIYMALVRLIISLSISLMIREATHLTRQDTYKERHHRRKRSTPPPPS